MSDETEHKPPYGQDYTRKTYFTTNEGRTRKSYETITIDLTGYQRALLDLICDHEPDIARSLAQALNAEHKEIAKPAKTSRGDILRAILTSSLEAKASALLGNPQELPIAKHLKDEHLRSEEEAKYWIERIRLAGGVKCAEYLLSLNPPNNQAEVNQLLNTVHLTLDLFNERKLSTSYDWLSNDDTPLYFPVLSVDIRRSLVHIAETESLHLADFLDALRSYPHELSKEDND